MKPNNPFLISGYYGPEFFCDREQEAGSILEALQNGRNVTALVCRDSAGTAGFRSAKSVEPYKPVCAQLPARVYF